MSFIIIINLFTYLFFISKTGALCVTEMGIEPRAFTCEVWALGLSPIPSAAAPSFSYLPAGHTESLASASYCYCSLPHTWKSGLRGEEKQVDNWLPITFFSNYFSFSIT